MVALTEEHGFHDWTDEELEAHRQHFLAKHDAVRNEQSRRIIAERKLKRDALMMCGLSSHKAAIAASEVSA